MLQDDAVVSGRAAEARGLALQAYQGTVSRLFAFWELWPLAGLALVSALVYLRTAPVFGLPFDDSYISLQFARNLARHGFLTFDGETASAGATSLLHVALLALPIKAGVDPVRASVALGVALHLALMVAVYWLTWTIFRDRLAAALAAGSTAVIGYLVYDALNGMETTLFLVVSTAAAAAFLGARRDGHLLAAGVLAALAVLSRPEGVLLLGAIGLYYLLDRAWGQELLSLDTLRRLALLAGPSAVALIGLAVFYQVTTGSPTPGAATAKYLFFREFELPVTTKFDWAQGNVANFLGPLLPWLALSLFAIRRREALLFGFFWVGFILLYFWLFPGGLGHYWYRYQHLFLPAIAVFGSAGLVSLVRRARWQPLEAVGAAALGLVLVAAVLFQYNAFRHRYADDVYVNETRQVGIARYLRDVMAPGDTVATHDVGVIGYHLEGQVVDLVGLVNPDVTAYHDGRRLREYVDRVKPDYLVVFPSWERGRDFLKLGLAEEPQLFEEVRVFEDPTGRVEPFIAYKTHY